MSVTHDHHPFIKRTIGSAERKNTITSLPIPKYSMMLAPGKWVSLNKAPRITFDAPQLQHNWGMFVRDTIHPLLVDGKWNLIYYTVSLSFPFTCLFCLFCCFTRWTCEATNHNGIQCNYAVEIHLSTPCTANVALRILPTTTSYTLLLESIRVFFGCFIV